MRKLLGCAVLVVVVACTKPLKRDVEMFCAASDATNAKTLDVLGPYVMERARTAELRELVRQLGQGASVEAFTARMRELMQEAGVDSCRTLDVMFSP